MARDGLKQAFRRNPSGSIFREFTPVQVLTFGTAEFIGTAILLFLGCTGLVTGFVSENQSLLQISLTFGLTVGAIIQIIGHISKAHLNPAVTVCSLLLGHMNWATALVYILSQCVGATLGYGLVKAITPSSIMNGSNCCSQCNTVPHESLTSLQALLAEMLVTSILIFLVCSVWDKRNANNQDSAALKFGFTIAAICMAEAHYTGASMNPARSLGPAIWNSVWKQHWVYWLGPIGGSIVTTLFYMYVFDREDSRPEVEELGVPLTVVDGNKAGDGKQAAERGSKEDMAL